MNAKDAIVEEVRTAREAHAARFNYDLTAIYEDLKTKEPTGSHPLVSLQAFEPCSHGVCSRAGQQQFPHADV